ncbi:MAG: hypothetical protein P8Y52_02135 [Xanthomonadales bacterium]
MEYLVFLTVVLLFSGVCALVVARGSRRRAQGVAVGDQSGRSGTNDLQALRKRIDARDGQGSFGRWVDALVTPKRTVDDDPEYRRRAQESLRTLLEDRYGGAATRAAGSPRKGRSADGSIERTVGGPAPRRDRGIKGVRTPWGW